MIAELDVGRHAAGVVCHCPDVNGEHSHQVPPDPMPCGCCGKPLELSCGGQGSKRHQLQFIREARARAAARLTTPSPRKSASRRLAVFEEKACSCGKKFMPTGPNSKRCPECREKFARGER